MRDYPTLIIEDEKPAARSLLRKLEKLGFTNLELLHSIEQCRKWFSNNPQPALIFLDIQLSDGISFEILEEFKIQSTIIFTTAYNEYALKAFKHNSIDYLLKPIIDEELLNAIEKYERRIDQKIQINYQQLKNLLTKDHSSFKSRFSIKIGQQIKIIGIDEIECFYSKDKATYIFTVNKEEYLIDQTLDKLETILDLQYFFRINRGMIIHIKAIKNIVIHSNSRLKVYLKNLEDQDSIVSRERTIDFKTWIE